MIDYTFFVLMVFFVIIMIRVIQGPSVWDRVLGFNLISSKIILIIVALASTTNTGFILDVAIIYAMFGFLGEIFLVQFLSKRTKSQQEGGKEE